MTLSTRCVGERRTLTGFRRCTRHVRPEGSPLVTKMEAWSGGPRYCDLCADEWVDNRLTPEEAQYVRDALYEALNADFFDHWNADALHALGEAMDKLSDHQGVA